MDIAIEKDILEPQVATEEEKNECLSIDSSENNDLDIESDNLDEDYDDDESEDFAEDYSEDLDSEIDE